MMQIEPAVSNSKVQYDCGVKQATTHAGNETSYASKLKIYLSILYKVAGVLWMYITIKYVYELMLTNDSTVNSEKRNGFYYFTASQFKYKSITVRMCFLKNVIKNG